MHALFYALILFDNQKIKIIKRDIINKVVMAEFGPGMIGEFLHILVKPYRMTEIQFTAGFVQSIEYLVCSGVVFIVLNHQIFYKMIVFDFLNPYTHRESIALIDILWYTIHWFFMVRYYAPRKTTI